MYPTKKPQHEHPLLKFILDNKLQKKASLNTLESLPDEPTVVFIVDGVKLLLDMEKAVRQAEPLSTMTSALPVTTYTTMTETLTLLQGVQQVCLENKKKFKPILVFNGCGYKPLERPMSPPIAPPESILARRAAEESGVDLVDPAAVEVYTNRFYLEEDIEGFIVRNLFQQFRGFGEVMRAPYLCWSQISAMLSPKNRFGSEVYGSIELLAFPGVDRVITSINTDTKTFQFVRKADLMSAVNAKWNPISASDLSYFILYGSRHRDFLVTDIPDTFEEMLNTTELFNGATTRVQAFLSSVRPDQKACLQRSTAALEAPVLTKTGACVPLRELYDMAPKHNIVQFFGKPLPPAMYFLLASGPMIPAPFASVSQFYLLDQWPLVDSKLYRSKSEYIISLRAQTLHHLHLDRNGRGDKRLLWQRDYNLRNSRTTTIAIPSATNLCQWDITEQDFPPNEEVYFYSVLRYADRSVHDMGEMKQPNTIQTTLAVVLLRTIDLLGYISHRDVLYSSLSQIGKCLEVFDCPTLSEYGLLFIELLRTQTLADTHIAMSLTTTTAQFPSGARFAARLLSIIHINCSGPWRGPIDAELAAFGSCSRMLCRTLRCLAEAVTTNIFLERTTTLPLEDLPEVVQHLPFSFVSEFNAGILVMHMIMNENSTLASLRNVFPELFTLEDDLQTLFHFWVKAYQAYQAMCEDPEEQANFMHYQVIFRDANALVVKAFSRVLNYTN